MLKNYYLLQNGIFTRDISEMSLPRRDEFLESADDKSLADLVIREFLLSHVANRPLTTAGFNELEDPSVHRLREVSKKSLDNNALCRRR